MGDKEPRSTTTTGDGTETGASSDALDATAGDVASGAGDAEQASGEDDLSEEDLDEETVVGGATAAASSLLGNDCVIGRLTLHYESRDVKFLIDGAAAMRIMAMFARRREGDLGERLTQHSSAVAGWLVVDLDEPLAMSWSPGVGRAPRTAVDPLIAAAS